MVALCVVITFMNVCIKTQLAPDLSQTLLISYGCLCLLLGEVGHKEKCVKNIFYCSFYLSCFLLCDITSQMVGKRLMISP